MSLVMTTYGRQLLLDYFFTPAEAVTVSTLYVCYCNNVPESNADGSELTEPDPVLTGYARQAYPLDGDHWAPTGFGEVFNTDTRTFPNVDSEWGLIQGIAFATAAIVGTGSVLLVGSVAEPFQPEVGTAPIFGVGDATVGLYE